MTKVTSSLAGIKLFWHRNAPESTADLWYTRGNSRRAFNFKDIQFFLTVQKNSVNWRISTHTISCLHFSHQFFKNIVPKYHWHKELGINGLHVLYTFLVKYNRTGCLIWKTEANIWLFKVYLDITDSWIHIYLNCHFVFLIPMILGRSVYNDFSTKFWYLYEKCIHRFKDLWKKTP